MTELSTGCAPVYSPSVTGTPSEARSILSGVPSQKPNPTLQGKEDSSSWPDDYSQAWYEGVEDKYLRGWVKAVVTDLPLAGRLSDVEHEKQENVIMASLKSQGPSIIRSAGLAHTPFDEHASTRVDINEKDPVRQLLSSPGKVDVNLQVTFKSPVGEKQLSVRHAAVVATDITRAGFQDFRTATEAVFQKAAVNVRLPANMSDEDKRHINSALRDRLKSVPAHLLYKAENRFLAQTSMSHGCLADINVQALEVQGSGSESAFGDYTLYATYGGHCYVGTASMRNKWQDLKTVQIPVLSLGLKPTSDFWPQPVSDTAGSQ